MTGFPSRNTWTAQRTLARTQNRGEAMVLRHVSLLAGPEPFKNPPDTSGDLTVVAGSLVGDQAYVGLAGTSVIGRLLAGDSIVLGGSSPTALTVMTMPTDVMTNTDGIPVVDGSGNPTFGTPPVYNADTLGWENAFLVIAVSGTSTPASLIGAPVTDLVFGADTTVFGVQMSYQQMVQIGWVEVDAIGVRIAAHEVTHEPQVNDILLINGGTEKRSVMQVGRVTRAGVDMSYPLQLR